MLTRKDPRQEEVFLRRRAVMHQHRGDHLEPLRQQAWRAGPRAFGGKHIFLHRRPAGPAILGRPVDRAPAARGQDLLPGNRMLRLGKHRGRPPSGAGTKLTGLSTLNISTDGSALERTNVVK